MKPKLVPNEHQIRLADDEFIVSKTDLKGRFTYANRTFMKIAGYSGNELINKQHNLVRHPDMPRGVFRLLWDTISQGQEFFGYVKNMTSDGSYYWVFANVTPDFNNQGDIYGYFSVRRKPREAAIAIIEPIYREMLTIEQQHGPKNGIDASIQYLTSKIEAHNTSYEQFVLSI